MVQGTTHFSLFGTKIQMVFVFLQAHRTQAAGHVHRHVCGPLDLLCCFRWGLGGRQSASQWMCASTSVLVWFLSFQRAHRNELNDRNDPTASIFCIGLPHRGEPRSVNEECWNASLGSPCPSLFAQPAHAQRSLLAGFFGIVLGRGVQRAYAAWPAPPPPLASVSAVLSHKRALYSGFLPCSLHEPGNILFSILQPF